MPFVKDASGEDTDQAEFRTFNERGQFVAAGMSDVLVESCTALANGQSNGVLTFADATGQWLSTNRPATA